MKPNLTPLESSLLAIAGTDRNGGIVARHFGFDGRGGANFRVIGDEVGLTRERVRQIVLEGTTLRRHRGARVPQLERAIAVIGCHLPARACEVEKRFRSEGLTSRPFRLEGIVNAAKLIGRRLPFSITILGGERFVLGLEFDGFKHIRLLAREKVRQYGMASVSGLLTRNPDPEAAQRERNILETALSAEKDIQWLDNSSEWFWFSEARGNLLLRRIRKMLCVANPLRVEDLRAGLARISDTLPPNSVLLVFCRQAPGITVEGDVIRPEPLANLDDVLNPTEQDIVRILSEHGGCLSNSELICRANDLGIKRPTFYQCVSHSPIVSRHRGLYTLIGSTRQAEPIINGVGLQQPSATYLVAQSTEM